MQRLPSFLSLRALEAAARHRSYSRAAAELAVTHGAVSQQIRRLEDELGATLFERRGNSMEPTPEALRLAGEVARALGVLRDGVAAFTGAQQRDPLVLSVGGFMARRWLPPRLPRLMAHPAGEGLQIQVVDRHVDLASEADAGIRYGTGQWDGLQAQRLYGEDMFPVCAPALAEALPIRGRADVARAPLLHLRTRPWSIWFSKFGRGRTAPADGPAFDDALLMSEAAAQGLGLGLAAASMVEDELRSGRLVRPLGDDGVVNVDIYLVWPRGSSKLARIHALRDWLLAEVAADQASGAAGPGG